MRYGKVPKQKADCKKQLFALLKGKGIADKKYADAIVDTFLETEKHISVDDFSALLKKKNIDLDTALIQLALDTLTEFGFSVVREFEGEVVRRYEHLHPREHHDHFICVKCGKIVEFSSDELEGMQESFLMKKGFKPLYHKLEVYGMCNLCGYGQKKAVPITFTKEGTVVQYARIEGEKGFKKRLIELGFIENEKIRIVKNSHFAPVVLEIKGSRFAIGQGQARKIMVYEE